MNTSGGSTTWSSADTIRGIWVTPALPRGCRRSYAPLQSFRWTTSSSGLRRGLAERLVAVAEEDGRLDEHARRHVQQLLDLRFAQAEERREQRRHAERVRGEHHVLARLEQARRRGRPGNRSSRAQRAVGVLLVLALHADAAVGVPEHEHDGAHAVDVLDRGVAGDRPAGAVDQLLGRLRAPLVDGDERLRQHLLQLALDVAVGDDDELPRLGVAGAAGTRRGGEDPREHVVGDRAVLVDRVARSP